MKLEILTKTRLRERRGSAIVTRYGCTILRDNEAQSENSERPANVQITIVADDLAGGSKDIGGTIEIA